MSFSYKDIIKVNPKPSMYNLSSASSWLWTSKKDNTTFKFVSNDPSPRLAYNASTPKDGSYGILFIINSNGKRIFEGHYTFFPENGKWYFSYNSKKIEVKSIVLSTTPPIMILSDEINGDIEYWGGH